MSRVKESLRLAALATQSNVAASRRCRSGPIFKVCFPNDSSGEPVTLTFLTKSCSPQNRRRAVFRWWLLVARHDLRPSGKRSKEAFPTSEQLWTLLPFIVKLLYATIDRSNWRQNVIRRTRYETRISFDAASWVTIHNVHSVRDILETM